MRKLIGTLLMLCFAGQAFAQEGLCPGNPMLSALLYPAEPPAEMDSPAARITRDREHLLALRAADVIYDLGDLERHRIFGEKGNPTGADMLEQFRLFVASIPAGYEVYRTFADHEMGLKYMVLQPADASEPWIFSIAGTETTLDWIGNLDLGRSQLEKLSRVFDLFTTCSYMAADKSPITAHRFIFTGHSLGGGLAQAFAYKIQSKRLKLGLRPLNLQVVTFNGFGGKPLIEKSELVDSRIEELVNASNYFVKEDPVSRIGQHLGKTYQLTPVGEDPDVPLSIRNTGELGRRHSMAYLEELATGDVIYLSGLASAPQKAPREFLFLRELTKLGGIALFMGNVLPRRFEDMRVVSAIEQAADILLGTGIENAADRQVLQLLTEYVRSRVEEMDRPSNGLLAGLALRDLRRVLARLNASRPVSIRRF